eukprot:CAMPEP_0174884692 /NCGR_PEP_ID=MMETSP0167-20121228/133_1 /TAXON_ID=38298 /ORGANISM="Rhodella maculata, Strain CCMP736" /LENGTH=68 /DNA_ID=CAMNT_0016120121 /DNA_START=65 /DNA_END=267 /DNA_ORIENTATION=-
MLAASAGSRALNCRLSGTIQLGRVRAGERVEAGYGEEPMEKAGMEGVGALCGGRGEGGTGGFKRGRGG